MFQRLFAFALGAALIGAGSADPHRKCKSHEEFKCGPIIEATCYDMDPEQPRDAFCLDGCFCRDGYVRGNKWKCVRLQSCPACPPNATWSLTGGNLRTCRSPRGRPSTKSGCFCNENYLQDTSVMGNPCVFWKDCPCSEKNQYYHDQVPKYPKTCCHRSNSPIHDIYLEDWKACICQEGYVLNNQECIPVEACPITPCQERCAKKDEQYVACARDINCNMTYTITDCKEGCQCLEGFARDSSGICIPLNQCPCMGNATFRMGVSACPETCSSQGGIRCFALLEAGCACDPGYVLTDKRDKCVLKDECGPSEDDKCKIEDPNKEYRTDQSANCILSCDNLNPVACTDDRINGCFCKLPFIEVSVANETCIRPIECPKPQVTQQCPETMKYAKRGRLFFCTNKLPEYRQNNCICPVGKLYDEIANKCVEPRQCSYPEEEEKCFNLDPNKEYHQCRSSLCAPTCEKIYPDYCKRKCTAGCCCRNSLLQVSDNNTDCVFPSDCPINNCGLHATLTGECVVSKRCDNMYLDFNQIFCDGVERCICDDGYVENSIGTCVLPEECTEEEIVCPQNMVYSTCHGCPRTCENTDTVCKTMCRKGCGCMENYFLNKDNVCVAESDCAKECPTNEEYKQCKDLHPDTCSSLLENTSQYKQYREECVAGCDCQKNYVRNSNGTCVDPMDCKPYEYKCGPNMVYTGNPLQCDICQSSKPASFVMADGCDCNANLAFDSATGMCVTPAMCTESKENQECKKKNHMHYGVNVGYEKTCMGGKYYFIPFNGCVCDENYVKDENNVCIPEDNCPNLNDQQCKNYDPNSYYTPNVCERNCSVQNPPTTCTASCICQYGYAKIDQKCVLLEDCKDCGPYATYKQYVNNCGRTCQTYRMGLLFCPMIISRPGCDCNDNAVRNAAGQCIPFHQCPNSEVRCPSGTHFEKRDKPRTCGDLKMKNDQYTKDCFCVEPKVYNEGTRKCVMPEDCPNDGNV